MISAVNKYSIQRWETKAAPWSHENEGKKRFHCSSDARIAKNKWIYVLNLSWDDWVALIVLNKVS